MSKFLVTSQTKSRSYELMLNELEEFGSTLLLIGTFSFVLIVILVISLAAIPGRVRGRKR